MFAAIKALWLWFLSLFGVEKPAASAPVHVPVITDEALNEFPLNGALKDEVDPRDHIFGQDIRKEQP